MTNMTSRPLIFRRFPAAFFLFDQLFQALVPSSNKQDDNNHSNFATFPCLFSNLCFSACLGSEYNVILLAAIHLLPLVNLPTPL